MKKKRCGIYIFTDASNNFKYIGKSVDMQRRIDEHYLCKGKNRHFYYALALRPDQFSVEMIELPLASDAELNTLEICYIHVLNTIHPHGYNLTQGGTGGRQSFETRQQMSVSGKTKFFTHEHRQKISESGKGRVFTPEHRRRISEATRGQNNPMYGKPRTPEQKKAQSEKMTGTNHPNYGKPSPLKGKHRPPEVCAKLSQATKGKNNPMYGKRGKDNPNYGKPFSEERKQKLRVPKSEEHKRKLSEASKRRYANRDKRRGQMQLW